MQTLCDTGSGTVRLPNFLQRGIAKYSVSPAIALETSLLTPVPQSLLHAVPNSSEHLLVCHFCCCGCGLFAVCLRLSSQEGCWTFDPWIATSQVVGLQVCATQGSHWLAIPGKVLVKECLFRSIESKIIPHGIVYPFGTSSAIWRLCFYFFFPLWSLRHFFVFLCA